MTDKMDVSVIVATRNRASSLERLLEGLANHSCRPSFEVIVGDNGSQDRTVQVVKNAARRMKCRYVRVEQPGKCRTLNVAIKHACGSLLVFTDDDVVPQPGWLTSLHAASVDYPDCNIFGGQIDVNLTSVPTWVYRSFNLMSLLACVHKRGESNRRYDFGDYPIGPNMAIRRKIVAKIDTPFPEHMGPGTLQPVGDENYFFMQFSPPEASDRLFVSSACVTHEVEEENVTFKHALKRCYLSGNAGGYLGSPMVSRHQGKSASTAMTTIDRLRTCSSPQELVCISVRFLGYIVGLYRLKKRLRRLSAR